MQLELAAIDGGKEILAQKWNECGQRDDGKRQHSRQEGAAMVQAHLENSLITLPKMLERFFKPNLETNQRIVTRPG